MDDYPYQATIVGQQAMPESPRGKWLFLNKMIQKVEPGQTVRLIIPKGVHRSSIDTAWIRACKNKGVIKHSRLIRNSDGSAIIYLWYESKQRSEEEG